MFASWPMVFGALVAGLVAGFLIPEAKQPTRPPSSTVAAKTSDPAKTSEQPKAVEQAKASETAKAPEPKVAAPATNNASAPATQSAANDDCERQTWPYLTPNCLDRSAQTATPDVVVQTKATEPKPVNDSERKPEPVQASAAAAVSGAPKADTNASTKSAATAAAPDETRPADRHQPAQAAAPEKQVTPTPEKSARRPAARARAEAIDEPVRPRAERYRGERRYAGQIEDEDDRPVYIRRGGRLYLAPEYHHHLRMQDRYWREW